MEVYRLNNVGFRYNERQVLININMKVSRNEFIAIVGPNGAGKSTLLKVMDFLLPPFSGEIYFEGKKIVNISSIKAMAPVRKKVGLVFQDPDIELFSPTIYEDLAFGPIHLGLDENEIESRVREVARMMRIENLLERPPFYLSDGEKKKCAIASVLTMDPEVLMVDEPTANLDPKSRREITGILKEMWKNGKTIIITTHELKIIENLAERVVVMNEGRVVADGEASAIIRDERLLGENNLE